MPVDPATGRLRWQAPVPGADALTTVGDRVAAISSRGLGTSQLFDPAGHQLLAAADRDGSMRPVNAAGLLVFDRTAGAPGIGGAATASEVVGVNASDGSRAVLGTVPGASAVVCSWNQSLLVCPGHNRLDIWQYATG
ncbi:MAG TPA: hypothetical protein VGJ07_22425 [Rugosimonospora sp.]